MVYFCYPETKGVTLEQIDHIFLGQGKGLGALTQGVRESIHAKKMVEHHEVTVSDEETPDMVGSEKDCPMKHVEGAGE